MYVYWYFIENEDSFTLDSIEIDSSKLKQINRQELIVRSDRNNENQLTRCFEKQFELFQGNEKSSINENVLLKIFTKHLSLCEDETIQEKLTHLRPFITMKSYPLIYEGVKDFVQKVLKEIDAILTEMESLWSRKRSQPSLQSIVTDLKRLRSAKSKQSFDSLVKVSDAFKFNNQKFVYRQEVCEDLVQEALERIGANNYGPSKRFAKVLEKCFDSEVEKETETEEEEEEENCNKSEEQVKEFDFTDTDESIELEDSTDILVQETSKVSLSVRDINKLQAAIKRKLKEKLKTL